MYPKIKIKFPFNEPENTAVFTCCHIIDDNAPVLYVSHDEDGDWQFLCGSEGHSTDDARIVSLREIIDLEPSVAFLSQMAEGGYAVRKNRSSRWVGYTK